MRRSALGIWMVLLFTGTAGSVAHGAVNDAVTAVPDPDRARTLVHVLDYVAADYPAAVSDGVVIDAMEFAEMEQFAVLADSLVQGLIADGTLPRDLDLPAAVAELAEHIERLADSDAVARTARGIRDAVIASADIALSPVRWPRIDAGEGLYATYCVACHGETGLGDGPLAPTMEPVPANLAQGERIAGISPFQVFNTVRLGVEGTGMSGFPQLSEREVWDIAFFVKSLQSANGLSAARVGEHSDAMAVRQAVSLEAVASMNDFELTDAVRETGLGEEDAAVALLRMALPPSDRAGSLDVAEAYLDHVLESYRAGDAGAAQRWAVAAYLEGVEPVEPVLRASDPAAVARIEEVMISVRSVIQDREPVAALETSVASARVAISEARSILAESDYSAWFTFAMALSILLREALEAFLIIITILGVIRASGQHRASRWVHGGWIAAVLVGVGGWFLVDALIRMSAAQREILEGAIALLAVVVLLTVGYWLHGMTSIRRWKAFIDQRIKSEMGRGSLVGLALFAFFAVFREAFESVLFLSALNLDGGEGSSLAIGSAALLSLVAVLVAGGLAVRYSARIPVRQLFRYASWIVVALAVILAGKGVHALQEAGRLSASLTGLSVRIELLGVYPTVETIVGQALVVGTVALLWMLSRRTAARTEVA